jgi:hypothetical protein
LLSQNITRRTRFVQAFGEVGRLGPFGRIYL